MSPVETAEPPAATEENKPGETGETQLDIANRDETEDQQPDPVHAELIKVLEDYAWRKSSSELIQWCVKQTSTYYQYIIATGKMALWRLVFEQYNRSFITLGSISRGGTEGELLNLPINEFRNIIDHVVGISDNDQLAFEPQPINNDYSTHAQVTLSKGILNDYAKHKGLGDVCSRTGLNTYLFGEGDVLKLWAEWLGDINMVDTKNESITRKGDTWFIELNPTNVIRDINVKNFRDNQWFIARVFVNKYDLAAVFPEKAKDIVKISIATDWDNTQMTASRGEKSDLIPLYIAIHKQTPAVPFGRLVFYLDGDTWLQDGHLEYREFPMYTCMPAPVESINFGYTTAFDELPLQQILDIIDGGLATNLSNFLVSNILVPDGCNLGVADLIGSMNLLKYTASQGKPEALNLVMFPPEAPAFRAFIVQRMEVLAGINSTNRGQSDDKITSGIMAALYASQAFRFNSKYQKAYAGFCGKLASGILYDLQDHPEEKRTGLVAGKGNRGYLKEFYGKDVNMIDRVTVQVGSAFAQTEAGKVQMAQDLMNSPAGLEPRQYLEVIETGSLDSLTDDAHTENMYIDDENDQLMDGKPVSAIISDNHPAHMMRHRRITYDPDLRDRVAQGDPKADELMKNALHHIAQHEQLMMQLQKTRPMLAAAIGLAPQGPPAGAPKPTGRPMPGKPPMPAGAPAARPPSGGPPIARKPVAPPARPKVGTPGTGKAGVATPRPAAPPMAGAGAHA